uniref:Uncharacterized protein n=1 Tax=Marmota marmota marmota TaxID=9994 RepID=A0A8C5ZXV8_MARMA
MEIDPEQSPRRQTGSGWAEKSFKNMPGLRPGAVVHACNPNYLGGTEVGGSQVRGQPKQLSKTLSNLVRLCLKIKNKRGLGI